MARTLVLPRLVIAVCDVLETEADVAVSTVAVASGGAQFKSTARTTKISLFRTSN